MPANNMLKFRHITQQIKTPRLARRRFFYWLRKKSLKFFPGGFDTHSKGKKVHQENAP